MNRRKLSTLFKSYKMQIKPNSNYIRVIDGLETNIWTSDNVIGFHNEQSHTCCGTEEFGDITFSDLWDTLPQNIANEVVNYSFKESDKFQIIYSLENSDAWNKLNEALRVTGWIPLKRWKGNGRNMIQAWCR